jgi:EAL domain-containing protein (putative c-di-GMP-specific phosphodiesterase class I)
MRSHDHSPSARHDAPESTSRRRRKRPLGLLGVGGLLRLKDRALSVSDQAAAATDQRSSDADGVASTLGWAASRDAQHRSDLEQQASDADQAAADQEAGSGTAPTASQQARSAESRAIRLDATADRAAATNNRAAADTVRADQDRSRQHTSEERDSASDKRDAFAELRDQADAAAEEGDRASDWPASAAHDRTVAAAERSAAAELRRAAAAARASELVQAATIALEISRAFDRVDEPTPGAEGADRAQRIRELLPGAATRGEFALHYQPLYSLARGELHGFEALLRWTAPDLGVISPDEFIPIAEETGAIVPIGDWVLDTALHALAQWRTERPGRALSVAVNIAPEQLLVDSFVETVADRLARAKLPASALTLEVTERTLVSDSLALQSAMERLRVVGVQLSVDDFGTGFSSLGRLCTLPLDEIKIDRIFIAGLATDRRQRALVAGIVAMSIALDLRVVAEGIETQEQRDLLAELGCEIGQGYLLGRPADAASTASLIAGVATHRRRSADDGDRAALRLRLDDVEPQVEVVEQREHGVQRVE